MANMDTILTAYSMKDFTVLIKRTVVLLSRRNQRENLMIFLDKIKLIVLPNVEFGIKIDFR